jgi:putative transposase
VIGQPRSSQRYEGRKADRDRDLLERMIGLSRKNPRYGYRRVWAMLRREGWPVNKKRVHRLWRKESLKIPEGKQHKRERAPPDPGRKREQLHEEAGHTPKPRLEL